MQAAELEALERDWQLVTESNAGLKSMVAAQLAQHALQRPQPPGAAQLGAAPGSEPPRGLGAFIGMEPVLVKYVYSYI